MEKWLLRKAFDDAEDPLLPAQVLWRRKEAFSDGVSSTESSWHHQIQAYASEMYETSAANKENEFTPEQQWFRKVFESHYGNAHAIIPYEWLPKWANQKDPSARALPQYE